MALVFARPRAALTMAETLLARDPGPAQAALAHQAIGIVQREFGDLAAAITHLRRAVALAQRTGSSDREADVLATLGVALVQAGRAGQGLAAFTRAVAAARGLTSARIMFRRAGALRILGRYPEALDDLRRAVPVLRRAGDTIWLARALNVRALVYIALGAADRADADLDTAGTLFAVTGQEHDSALVTQNRGHAAYVAGNLPDALSHLDDAGRRFARIGDPMYGLEVDRCDVLLAAGLAHEALDAADAALTRLERLRGPSTKRAQLLLASARAALATGDPATAATRAAAAARMFAAQGRSWWHAHARLLQSQARFAAGTASARLMRDAAETAGRLARQGSAECAQAHLLAGRTALALSRRAEAERHLAAAANARRRGTALARISGWLAEALLADGAGNRRRLLRACARGLEVLDEHRHTLGAAELRARAGVEGAELAALALRSCLARGRIRDLVVWAERGRAAALAGPLVRPPDDRGLRTQLTAFREVTGRLQEARSRGETAHDLERDRDRLERDIRARTLRARGPGPAGRRPDGRRFHLPALLDQLGTERLVEIIELDGRLRALVCADGTVRDFAGGLAAETETEIEYARSALRRLAHGRVVRGRRDKDPDTVDPLESTARRLELALLGGAADHLGDGPVTIVPPSRLHGVPWAMLPCLRDRVHAVAPSAAAWLRARTSRAAPGHEVVLVRGPGLHTGGAEVPTLASGYPAATVLENGTATASRVLAALDGCALAHIAAHGTFRVDSPMFSSLRLDDGPLTFHDLTRLHQAPYRLVLPSCDSGQVMPVGADDLLGLATVLLPLGTAGIVASPLPVNDEATVALMLALHDGLRAGGTMAYALREARRSLPDEPVYRATGWSFVALGPA